jgi:DNA-binding transcriptional LysR family regulator
LEAQLGITLFHRSASGMVATAPAQLLAPRAEAAIDLIGSSRVTATQINAFLAVARAGSYAGASEVTGLSSAALHRAVADLAVALGQSLIEKRGRSLLLTPAGHKRVRSFQLAMSELRAGMDEINAWQGKISGRLLIGAMPLSRARWLPDTILRFQSCYPDVALSIIEGSHTELSSALRDGEIDLMLGALREDASTEGLDQHPVFDDHPMLVMRVAHPLLRAANPAANLCNYPWILPAPQTPLRRYWQDMMQAAGHLPPPIAVECGSVITIRQMLLASDAITLLSPDQVSVELAAGLVATLPPPQPIIRQIGITTRQGWRPTQMQSAFVDYLSQYS